MRIFVSHTSRDKELAANLAAHLRESGYTVALPQDFALGREVLGEISAAIRSAAVVVALLTEMNANVFYELGLATGANVPVIVAVRHTDSLPWDVRAVPYVQLTGDMPRDAQAIARRAEELKGLATARPVELASAEATLTEASRNPGYLDALSPVDFERLVAKLFEDRGYNVTAADRSADAGVDLIIRESNNKEIVLVELKKLNQQSRVSVDSVRTLWGALSLAGASVGLLISSSGFTQAALALASGSPVILRTLGELLAAKSARDLLRK
jgi:restriction endonuclease Mrr